LDWLDNAARLDGGRPGERFPLDRRLCSDRAETTTYSLTLHRESKKQDTKLLAIITSPNIIRFSIFLFTSGLGSKFATNSCLNFPPRFKHVATLPCEI